MSNPKSSASQFAFTISDEADIGARLDVFLTRRFESSEKLPRLSRARLQKLITQGQVALDGVAVTAPRTIMRQGMKVRVTVPAQAPSTLQAEEIPLKIIFEDATLLVLNKPPHLTVHPGAGVHGGTLVQALLHHCSDLSTIGGPLRPGIVHRLDKETSGVLLVAKNDAAHHALASQFEKREVEKVYETIVRGKMPQESGTVNAAIGRHPIHRQKMTSRQAVRHKPARARDAVTEWEVLQQFAHFAHLAIHPKTGRTHQIRIHLADLGHSVVGDKVYGSKPNSGVKWPAELLAGINEVSRQMLHARSLSFTHPRTQERLTFEAPLPDDFAQLLELLENFD